MATFTSLTSSPLHGRLASLLIHPTSAAASPVATKMCQNPQKLKIKSLE